MGTMTSTENRTATTGDPGTCERREGEGITEFTMRRIRNEIIEQCAVAVEGEEVGRQTGHPEDAAYNTAIEHAAEAVRLLKR